MLKLSWNTWYIVILTALFCWYYDWTSILVLHLLIANDNLLYTFISILLSLHEMICKIYLLNLELELELLFSSSSFDFPLYSNKLGIGQSIESWMWWWRCQQLGDFTYLTWLSFFDCDGMEASKCLLNRVWLVYWVKLEVFFHWKSFLIHNNYS